MTHHTEAERAEPEHLHQLLELVLKELDRKAFPFAYMQDIDRKGKAFIEQVARRAPAAPVPQGVLEAAQRAHDWMDSQADSQSKGNFHSFDLLCLRQERDALAEALAASQPNGEAA